MSSNMQKLRALWLLIHHILPCRYARCNKLQLNKVLSCRKFTPSPHKAHLLTANSAHKPVLCKSWLPFLMLGCGWPLFSGTSSGRVSWIATPRLLDLTKQLRGAAPRPASQIRHQMSAPLFTSVWTLLLLLLLLLQSAVRTLLHTHCSAAEVHLPLKWHFFHIFIGWKAGKRYKSIAKMMFLWTSAHLCGDGCFLPQTTRDQFIFIPVIGNESAAYPFHLVFLIIQAIIYYSFKFSNSWTPSNWMNLLNCAKIGG